MTWKAGYVVTGKHMTSGVRLYAAARGKGDRGQTRDVAEAQFFTSERAADRRRWAMANPYVFWDVVGCDRSDDGRTEF